MLAPTAVQAQRAGLWETRVDMAGQPARLPTRSCMVAGEHLRALARWPANCSVDAPTRTASRSITQAVCRTSGTNVALVMRRELTGDLNQQYQVTTASRVDGVSAAVVANQSSILTLRYLGPCAGAAGRARDDRKAGVPGPLAILGFVAIGILELIGSVATTYGLYRVMAWLIVRLYRKRYARQIVDNIVTDSTQAATIPVLATFAGVRGMPWWHAIAANSAKPLLVIEPGGVRFRVIRKQRRDWQDIECVDIRRARGTVNIRFRFHGSLLTFSANLGAVPLASHVLSLLPRHVPLSERASAIKAVGA